MTDDATVMGYPPGMARPSGGVVTPSFREFLPAWLQSQRWWRSGAAPATRVGAARWEDPQGQVGIDIHVVTAGQGANAVTYHVPLTYRGAPLPGVPESALLATVEHSELGTRWIYDAAHDPVYVEQAVRRSLGTTEVTLLRHEVKGGEQSNSSVIVHLEWPHSGHQTLMLKVFRVLHHGPNPEVTSAEALTRVGCPATAGFAGSWEVSWLPHGHGNEVATSHAGVLSEFIPDAVDGWLLWADAVVRGQSVESAARDLGATIARVHEALSATAEGLSSRGMTCRALEIHQEWRERWETAVAYAPQLAALTPAAESVYAAAMDHTPWPAFQAVHGDLHLGQVLYSPTRGWVVVDFEGEPLRSPDVRTRPDQPARDVAGMVRSVAYVAAKAVQDGATVVQCERWREATVRALLEGYSGQLGHSVPEPLLMAFMLDRAAVEVTYEALHRPSWLPIPVQAVQQLLRATA